MLLLAAKVWTYWMGVGVVLLVVPAGLLTAAMYFVKVVRPKYPPRTERKG